MPGLAGGGREDTQHGWGEMQQAHNECTVVFWAVTQALTPGTWGWAHRHRAHIL